MERESEILRGSDNNNELIIDPLGRHPFEAAGAAGWQRSLNERVTVTSLDPTACTFVKYSTLAFGKLASQLQIGY